MPQQSSVFDQAASELSGAPAPRPPVSSTPVPDIFNQAHADLSSFKPPPSYSGLSPDPFTPDWNTPLNVAKGIGRGVSNLVMGVPRMLAEMGKEGSYTAPITGPMQAEAQKASQEMNAVHPSPMSAAGHTLASIIPIAGPWAAGIGERIGSGDIAGGIAEAATTMGIPALARAGAEALPPNAPRISGALTKAAEANRGPAPRASVLDLNELATRGAIGAGGAAVGSLLGHPAIGAEIATAIDLMRRSPTYRNLKASAQESLAREVGDIGSALKPAAEAPQEYIPPGAPGQLNASRTRYQGAGGPDVQVAPPATQQALPPAPPQGSLAGGFARATQQQLPAGPASLPGGSDAIGPTPDPRLTQKYATTDVGQTSPPAVMGNANLGQEGGIPPRGEQTVTATRPGISRNDIGQFRRATMEEATASRGTAGRTARELPAPTPPKRSVKK
jgi:hypothetical protein